MEKSRLPILLFILALTGYFFFYEKLITAETAPTGISENTPEPQVPDNQPLIAFDNPNFDFGKIFKGEKVEHIYKFENQGKDVLKIEKVNTSCGCTAAILSNKIIQPGESGEIKATFNSGSYSGKVRKNITVISNDLNSPEYRLTFSGEIIEEVCVTPKSINFASVYVGEEIVKTITVSSLTDLDLKIEKISTSVPFVSPLLTGKNEEGFLIEVTLKDTFEIKRFNGSISIETNSQRQPKITVPFFGEVVGDITTYPEKIYYGNVAEGREVIQKLFVKFNKDDIKILNVKISPSSLSTKITERYEQVNPHCLIEIRLHKEAAVGQLNGLLELITNSKRQPLIQIPIVGEIKEG
ncbi:MAG: DUF1573 domain-containing protein [Candidatus Scalindua sp.]|nr:DUF1573 domain-containing protein [Candidatus Scalindua sp.]